MEIGKTHLHWTKMKKNGKGEISTRITSTGDIAVGLTSTQLETNLHQHPVNTFLHPTISILNRK